MPLDESIVSSLPEEIRNEPSFAEMQKGDLPGVFKQAIDGQKALGRAIFLPDEKDPEDKRTEKLNSVYEKLGRPKAHTEYDRKTVFGELPVSDAQAERYTKAFHEAGLSPTQAARLVKEYQSELSGIKPLTIEDATKAIALGDEGKNNGWGEKTEANIGVAKAGLAKFDESGEFTAWLDETGLGNDPRMLRYLHKVGSQFQSDTTPPVGQSRGGDDKSSAQTKLATIMNDNKHPYWNRSMNGHDEAIKEVARLHEIIHGTQVVATVGKN